MAIITTKSAGIGEQSDPKPVRGIDYAGQPIPPGGYYNGRPEHSAPYIRKHKEHKPHSKRGWTAEKRKAFGNRMRAYWAQRKAQKGASDTQS
jgi:hypothetical protein